MKVNKFRIDEDQAKRLRELGINDMIGVYCPGSILFDVDGLIQLLPEIEMVGPHKDEIYQLNIHKTTEGWFAFYDGMEVLPPEEELIDAIYNLLVWCIKKKLKS